MKPLKFWRMQIQQLSLSERIFYKEVIKTLLTWGVLKRECLELNILQKMLESESNVTSQNDIRDERLLNTGYLSNYKKYLSEPRS